MSSNALQHHGILGMKWGVRRTPAQLGIKSKGGSDDKNRKKAKDMSDEELRKAVNRLQLEKQYSQLSSGKITKGKRYAKNILKAGTTVAAVTTTALSIYNNTGKIKDIVEKIGSK